MVQTELIREENVARKRQEMVTLLLIFLGFIPCSVSPCKQFPRGTFWEVEIRFWRQVQFGDTANGFSGRR